MELNDRLKIYKKTNIDNYQMQEIKVNTNQYFCNYTIELIDLMNKIPNWEIYFTEKQIQIAKLFYSYKNINDVANIMNLKSGTIYNILFGSKVKNYQGVYGKLKKIYSLMIYNKNL